MRILWKAAGLPHGFSSDVETSFPNRHSAVSAVRNFALAEVHLRSRVQRFGATRSFELRQPRRPTFACESDRHGNDALGLGAWGKRFSRRHRAAVFHGPV